MHYLIVAFGVLLWGAPKVLTPLRQHPSVLIRHVLQTVGGLLLLFLMATIFIFLQLLLNL